ncbi:hypothetical protein T08_12435 [Trichinella sp. T8]|nr:hypothetical protein T08_12435 [Trichinella sp. T8]
MGLARVPFIYLRSAILLRTNRRCLRWMTTFKEPEGQVAWWLARVRMVTCTHFVARAHSAQGGRSQPKTTVHHCRPWLRDTLCSELALTFLGRWKRPHRGTGASWS